MFMYFTITSVFGCIIDLILSYIVVYTFVSKLHNLTIHCQTNWIRNNSEHYNDLKDIKMIKAEKIHYKHEKKQFKHKTNQKKRRVTDDTMTIRNADVHRC